MAFGVSKSLPWLGNQMFVACPRQRPCTIHGGRWKSSSTSGRSAAHGRVAERSRALARSAGLAVADDLDDVLSGKSMAKRDGVKKALDAATSGEAVIALGG